MGFFVCVLIFLIAVIYIYQKDKFQSAVDSARIRDVEIQEQLVKDKKRMEEEGKAVGKRRDALIESLVIKHARILCKKIRQEERIDEYGKEVGFGAVGAHMAHFLSHVVCPEPEYQRFQQRLVSLSVQLILLGKDRTEYNVDSISAQVEKDLNDRLIPRIYLWAKAAEAMLAEKATSVEVEAFTGVEFEIFCEDRLRNLGWDVHRKGGTGDQGVDLLVRRGEIVVAIQCKRYSTSVGNFAVQQVEAGRQFEEAHWAAVVSNQDYTPSAKQLASKLNVILLHYSELDTLLELVATDLTDPRVIATSFS